MNRSNPSSPTRRSRPATTAGRLAALLAAIAVGALLIANTVFFRASGTAESIRVALLVGHLAAGIGALVAASVAIRKQDRGTIVWVSFVIGVLVVIVLALELTVLE